MHNPIPRQSRNQKSFKSDRLKKRNYINMNVSNVCSLDDGNLERKTRRRCSCGRAFIFFQSAGGTWDLLTGNSSKNENQVQWQRPWQRLKADVSGKGDARSQHTPTSLPELQHHQWQGWIWVSSQTLPCCTAASAVWYIGISLTRSRLCALLLPKAIHRLRKDTPRGLMASSSVHKRMLQSHGEAGRGEAG